MKAGSLLAGSVLPGAAFLTCSREPVSAASYRDTQLAYRNLIGSYLTAVAQLNPAVGKEVAQ